MNVTEGSCARGRRGWGGVRSVEGCPIEACEGFHEGPNPCHEFGEFSRTATVGKGDRSRGTARLSLRGAPKWADVAGPTVHTVHPLIHIQPTGHFEL